MSSKRLAERSLDQNHDYNEDSDNEVDPNATGKASLIADKDALPHRSFFKAKRKVSSDAPSSSSTTPAFPAFQFAPSSSSSSSSSASTTASTATTATTNADGSTNQTTTTTTETTATEPSTEGTKKAKTSTETNGAAASTESATSTTTAPATSTSTASAPSSSNWFSKFAKAAGSWDCPACDLNNKETATKCIACQTDKPGTTSTENKENETKPLFSFGAPPSTSSSSSTSSTTTTTTSTTSLTSTPFSAFNFSSGPIAFGSFGSSTTSSTSSGSTSSFSSFSFGSAFGSKSDSTSSFSSPFSSTSAPLSFGAISSSSSSSSSSADKEDSFAEGESSGGGGGEGGELKFDDAASSLQSKPVRDEAFKNAVAEKTGEEDDTITYRMGTKVYQLKAVKKKDEKGKDTEEVEQKWVEIGEGELHLNTYESKNKTKGRAILRTEKTQRLVLNAPIFDQMKVEASGEKYVKFYSFDLELKPVSFLLKFKSKTEASDTIQAFKSLTQKLTK